MVSFYLQPKPREQQSLSCIDLGWPPFWAHLGAICWAHLGAMWGMVLFYLQPRPREQQSLSCIGLGWPPFWAHLGAMRGHGLLLSSTQAPGATVPPILARGPRAMEPNLPLPGLMPLSFAFLGPVGRLYCQHLPPIARQGPQKTKDKQHLNLKKTVCNKQGALSPASSSYLGPRAPAQWSQTCPYQGRSPYLGSFLRPRALLLPASSPFLGPGPAQHGPQSACCTPWVLLGRPVPSIFLLSCSKGPRAT